MFQHKGVALMVPPSEAIRIVDSDRSSDIRLPA
jgi:hypothetical protein